MSNKYECRRCGLETEHAHTHDAAHGIEGTHMVGTERFRCSACGLITYARDKVPGFKFMIDEVPG